MILVENDSGKKRLIKTIQKKNFFKKGRWEASPHFAFVANDPFLNRYIVGTGLAYHVTEVFAVEGTFDFAPDLGEGDWKPLTTQLVNENSVSPDISKLTMFGSLTFQYSPIYGKLAIVGRDIILFDVYGNFGMGFTRTTDDLEALRPRATSVRSPPSSRRTPPQLRRWASHHLWRVDRRAGRSSVDGLHRNRQRNDPRDEEQPNHSSGCIVLLPQPEELISLRPGAHPEPFMSQNGPIAAMRFAAISFVSAVALAIPNTHSPFPVATSCRSWSTGSPRAWSSTP